MSSRFWKMSGSGNDFVFLDGRTDGSQIAEWTSPEFVRSVCEPHTGVGADGVAIIEHSDDHDFRLRYFNRDGSLGELCGNASLCATRLAVELTVALPGAISFETDAGVIRARMRHGQPEIDLQPPHDLKLDTGIAKGSGEKRLSFVNTGVPHLVIRSDDFATIDLRSRGPELRFHESLSAGANVNWVAPDPDGGWRMRTYERGVEAETLACGTGAVACAVLLEAWGETVRGQPTSLRTKSGKQLTVTLRAKAGQTVPSLSGEGRIVFEGVLRDLRG